MISRYIFDETMYRLCYSETLNVCFFRSAGRHCNGTAQPQSLSAAALCFTQIFSCGSLMRAYRLYHTEHLFVNLFRYIVTGKTAAVSDSRLLIDHLILFYTAFFLSAANGCEDSCATADKQ